MKKLILIGVILSSFALFAQAQAKAQTQEVLIILEQDYIAQNAIDNDDILLDGKPVIVVRHKLTDTLIIPGTETITLLDQINGMFFIVIEKGKTYTLQIKNNTYSGPIIQTIFKRNFVTYPEMFPGAD